LTGHVTCMGEIKNAYNILAGKLERSNHLEDLDIGKRIILDWILRKYNGKMWTGFIWLRKGLMASCCEHGNEHSVSIKGKEFLD